MICLRGFRPNRGNVSTGEFLEPLAVRVGPPIIEMRADRGPDAAALIVFFDGEASTYEEKLGAIQGVESFESELRGSLEGLAEWLGGRSPEVFHDLSAGGLEMDVFVDLGIDQDQLFLELPSSLLKACGDRRLPLRVISNT